jgi:outer membrane protein OmpA-like peptidoglycan-associated protein
MPFVFSVRATDRMFAGLGDAMVAADEFGTSRQHDSITLIREILMKLFTVICFSVLFFPAWSAGGRDFDKKLDRAEGLYHGGHFSNALPVYLELFKSDSTNLNVCYKIGACYLKTGIQHGKAIYYLEKAVRGATSEFDEASLKEKRAPLDSYKLLGDAYHLNYKFDEALKAYELYRQLLTKNRIHHRATHKDVLRRIEMCTNGKELVAHPANVKIANLGKSVNSSFPDYAPRLSADQNTMIFTSRRPENTGGRTYDGGQYFEDIYIATRKNGVWQTAENIGWPVNTVGNEAAIGISADGQEILIYKDDLGDGNIYSTKLEGDRWTTPAKLNAYINSPYWEPGAFLSADGLSLYFVSDRPGGLGGTDIYRSRRSPNGDWQRPVNLGPTVNTPYDEHSPYIHPDGVTLFFSSRGHNTMGGYDVFFTRALQKDERLWAKPVNVGYPINTPGDDAFYMVSTDKQSAYYSSMFADVIGDKDIYTVTFADAPAVPLSLHTGNVFTDDGKAAKDVVITVTDNETNEVEGVYHANAKTGKYLFVLTPGKSHNISYEADGKLFYSENRFAAESSTYTEVNHDVTLTGVDAGSSVTLNNIFFDFDDARLKPGSKTELDRVAALMKKHGDVEAEVSGYADSKGTDDYNKRLSLARAKAVVDYLVTAGIDAKRLRASGAGATSRANNDRKANSSGREADRRVELKIVKSK